jgi:hypothetical protein
MGGAPTIWARYFARDSPTHAPCCTLRAPSWYGKPKRLNVGPGGGQAPSRTKPGRYRSFQILNNWGRHDVPFSKRALFIWFALRLRWLRGKDRKGVRVCPLSHTLRVLHFQLGRLRVSAKASRGEFKLAPVVKSHGDFNLRSSQWYSAIGASLFHFE